MAALGQPVEATELSSPDAPAFQHQYQGMYQDPYAALQGYTTPQFMQAPGYPNYSDRAFQPDAPLAGALQWEMPQVCSAEHLKHMSMLPWYVIPSIKVPHDKKRPVGTPVNSMIRCQYCMRAALGSAQATPPQQNFPALTIKVSSISKRQTRLSSSSGTDTTLHRHHTVQAC